MILRATLLVLPFVLALAGSPLAQIDPATDPLVLVLSDSGSGALALRGGAFVQVDGLVHVNSSDACGLEVNGTPKTTALVAVGTTVVGDACFPDDTVEGGVTAGGTPLVDPLQNLLATTPAWDNFKAGLTVQPGDNGTGLIDGSGAGPYPPGFYAEGLVVEGGKTVTLDTGAFLFGGAGIQLHGGARLLSAPGGVTLLVDLGSTVDVSGNGAGMQIAARTISGFAGVAVFHHRENTGGAEFHVSGGGSVDIEGLVYVPGGGLTMSGNPGTEIGAVIADRFTAEGTPDGRVTGEGLVATLLQHQTIRVSVKRVLSAATNEAQDFWGDPNGPPGPDPDARIRDWVAGASMVLTDRAGIALELAEVVELVDPMFPVSWSFVDVDARPAMRAAVTADACRYAWRDNALNVYLASSAFSQSAGLWNLRCSFPHASTGDLIVLTPFTRNDGVGLAHEIGHVLGLFHTHETAFGFESFAGCGAAAPNCHVAGDLVCDTPSDPAQPAVLPWWYPCQDLHDTLAHNVMSAYEGIGTSEAVLTPGQVGRLHDALAQLPGIVADGSPPAPACRWTHLGQGLAGSQHVPILAGLGLLQGGQPFAITLDHARASSPAALLVGLAEIEAPYRGGVLVPFPQVVVGITTDPSGACALFGLWPSGVPSGLSVAFQAWILDPSAPEDFSASNGLRATTP